MGSAHVRRLDLSSAIIAVSWCLLVIATGKIIVNYEDTRILSFPYSGEWLSTIHVFPVLQAIQTIPIRLALRGGAGDQEMGGTEPQTPAQIKAKKLIDEAWEAHSGGDSHEAERLFKAALREDPESTEAMTKLAMIYEFELVRYDDAEELYKRAMALAPDDVSMIYDYAVFLQERRKDYDAAEAQYQRALILSPNDPSVLNNYAVFLQECRNATEMAEEMFQKSLAAAPNSSTALCNYASFLENNRGDVDKAEAIYKQALDLEPNEPAALYNYAIFLEEVRQDHDGAEALYKRVLQVDAADTDALNNYGLLLQNVRHNYQAARKLYEQALEADPTDLAAVNNIGVLYEDSLQEYDKAEQYYQRALQIGPDDVTSLCNYGAFLKNVRGNDMRAAGLLDKARGLDPLLAERLIKAQDERVDEGQSTLSRAPSSNGVSDTWIPTSAKSSYAHRESLKNVAMTPDRASPSTMGSYLPGYLLQDTRVRAIENDPTSTQPPRHGHNTHTYFNASSRAASSQPGSPDAGLARLQPQSL